MSRKSPISFKFHLPPNRANAREHWRATDRKKKQFMHDFLYMNHDIIKKYEKKKPVEYFTWYAEYEVSKYYDSDNIINLSKWPLDALKNYGIIVDDSWDRCRGEKWSDQRKKRGKEKFGYLTIYPCDEPFACN